jgi:hypothetical protein
MTNRLRWPPTIRLVGAALIGAAALIAVVLMAAAAAAVERVAPSSPPEPVQLTHTDGSRLHWLMLGGLLGLAVLLLLAAISVGVHGWLTRPLSERRARGNAAPPGAEVDEAGSFEEPKP